MPGYNITILNRGSKTKSPRYDYIMADRNDKENIKKLLKGKNYDIVFDISGTNEQQISSIINAINPKNIGLYVFLSSGAVYAGGYSVPFDEETPLGENGIWGKYGKEKIDCENYINKIHKTDKMKFLIIRPPYVYGPWNYIYRESYCFKRADENKPIIVPNDGEQKIQFIHVEDLCNAIISLVKNKESYNESYNIGKEVVTFKEWARMCMCATNKKTEIIFCEYKKLDLNSRDFFPFYDYSNILDIQKIKKYYTPQIDLSLSLYNCYNWYKDNKDYIDYRKYGDKETKIKNFLQKCL